MRREERRSKLISAFQLWWLRYSPTKAKRWTQTSPRTRSDISDQEMETGEFKGDDDRMDVDGEGDKGERQGRTKKKDKAVKRKIAAESSSSESSPER